MLAGYAGMYMRLLDFLSIKTVCTHSPERRSNNGIWQWHREVAGYTSNEYGQRQQTHMKCCLYCTGCLHSCAWTKLYMFVGVYKQWSLDPCGHGQMMKCMSPTLYADVENITCAFRALIGFVLSPSGVTAVNEHHTRLFELIDKYNKLYTKMTINFYLLVATYFYYKLTCCKNVLESSCHNLDS